jgi:hypothetical protein
MDARTSRSLSYAPTLAVVALLTALSVGFCRTPQAEAAINPAVVLDGPANNILDVDGAAMAPDGSGGIVYRKLVGGIVHVYAVPFGDGRWDAPVEVDDEDAYGASEPAIAAGEDGRLLVVWVQARNIGPSGITEYELMSASLQPGASTFGQAIAVNTNVGEPRTADIGAVDPKLAMAPDGAAYVVYRVVLDACGIGDENNPAEALCRPGSTDEVVSVRVARFNYLTWRSVGQINRDPQIAMRDPTSENAPSIGIALSGNGVVAWQEPDASGVARIWTRRLFGTVKGSVLEASPESSAGRGVTSDADAPSVAVGPYGEAQIAFRVHGAPGSAVMGAQLFVNSLPSEVAPHGATLQGATRIASAQGEIGAPSNSLDQREDFRLAWTQGGGVHEVGGSDRDPEAPFEIGSSSGQTQTTINPAGGGTTAWIAAGSPTVVGAREDYAQGAYQTAQLAGTVPGPIGGLSLGGDGHGDALIAFTQGPVGRSEVLGSFVPAPPAPFVLDLPSGWVRGRAAKLEWENAFDAVAGVIYTVYVDGKLRLRTTGSSMFLNPNGLGDGVHRVQVLATDASGQQTMSARGLLLVDAIPPIVRVARTDGGSGVRVTVTDSASGVDMHATRIDFGDGSRVNGRARVSHRYARPGIYTIVAWVRDRIGNHAVAHIRVSAR